MSIMENPYGNLTNNYDFTKDYWHILSAQLFFVIAFLVGDFCTLCNVILRSYTTARVEEYSGHR